MRGSNDVCPFPSCPSVGRVLDEKTKTSVVDGSRGRAGDQAPYALLDLHGEDGTKDIIPELGGDTVSEIKV